VDRRCIRRGILPFGFTIPVARKILADKSRSGLYEAACLGLLDFAKDGDKTLVTTTSIIRYLSERIKPAKIKAPPPPRKWGEPRRSKSQSVQLKA
jgi:hypothetical protein